MQTPREAGGKVLQGEEERRRGRKSKRKEEGGRGGKREEGAEGREGPAPPHLICIAFEKVQRVPSAQNGRKRTSERG
eukprot:429505-Rhodomonas_salina.1